MGKRRIPQVPPAGPIDSLLGKPVVAEVDLHGFDARGAEIRLESFLSRMSKPGLVVRIITGRGNRSEGGAVLRPLVDQLLRGRMSRYVAQHRIEPGGGAYLVEIGHRLADSS
jgi:DNA-nicking Smr family endonuclease